MNVEDGKKFTERLWLIHLMSVVSGAPLYHEQKNATKRNVQWTV
jgi:hypothetical protein